MTPTEQITALVSEQVKAAVDKEWWLKRVLIRSIAPLIVRWGLEFLIAYAAPYALPVLIKLMPLLRDWLRPEVMEGVDLVYAAVAMQPAQLHPAAKAVLGYTGQHVMRLPAPVFKPGKDVPGA